MINFTRISNGIVVWRWSFVVVCCGGCDILMEVARSERGVSSFGVMGISREELMKICTEMHGLLAGGKEVAVL